MTPKFLRVEVRDGHGWHWLAVFDPERERFARATAADQRRPARVVDDRGRVHAEYPGRDAVGVETR